MSAITEVVVPRVSLRASAGMLSLAGLVAAGLAVVLAAPSTRYLVLAGTGGPLPGWITGVFSGVDLELAPAALCLVLTAMLGCYVAALRWADTIPTRWGIGAILLLHLGFLLAPPLLSSDVFNYIDAGRLHALYGLNPYIATPLARAGDVAFPYSGAAWTGSASVYGPAFTLLSSLLAPLGVAAQLWIMKALAACASLGCVALIWSCARRLGRPPLQAAMFFGLNPVVLVLAVGGAHNDLLMSMLVLLALLLALADRTRLSVATLVGAAAIKLTAGLVMPFLIIGQRSRWPHAARAAIAAGVLIAAGAFALFHSAPLRALTTLNAGGARHVGELRSVPGFVAGYAGFGPINELERVLLGVLCLCVTAAVAWLAARGRLPWLTAACWSIVALLLTSTQLQPWYAVWLIPLAAVSSDRRVRAASHAIVLTISLIAFARYALRLGIHYPHGG
jgi:Glycosyltransferase family 87